MIKHVKFSRPEFVEDEAGAVTVDWVVLTAAIVGVAVIAINIIRPGIYEASSDIRAGIDLAVTGF